MDELADLETQGWTALSTDPDAARAFYDRVLDDEVTMVLPGGLTVVGRDEALTSMSGPPWDRFALSEVRVQHPTADTGLVTCSASATRGDLDYEALVSSLYVRRDGGWRLTFHQQTPT